MNWLPKVVNGEWRSRELSRSSDIKGLLSNAQNWVLSTFSFRFLPSVPSTLCCKYLPLSKCWLNWIACSLFFWGSNEKGWHQRTLLRTLVNQLVGTGVLAGITGIAMTTHDHAMTWPTPQPPACQGSIPLYQRFRTVRREHVHSVSEPSRISFRNKN